MSGKVISLPGRVTDDGGLRPPRLTFAGVCIWCGEHGCSEPGCIALHEISEWVVCGHCNGTGEASLRGCTCAFGLVLVAPLIRRYIEFVPGMGCMNEGHWSAYNHTKYHKEPADRFEVVAAPAPAAARVVA